MNHPARPWVLPFAVFILFLAVGDPLGLGRWEFPLRVAILAGVIWWGSREVLDLRMPYAAHSVLLGIAVFVVWIAPDVLWPGYREHWLFQNSLTGKVATSLPAGLETDRLVLTFRTIRAGLIVPIVEELFWRGWLMRWLIDNDFRKVPLGTFASGAFWITAVLFAVEHGPYWEVGLLAGIAYNWWMVRTKSLGDCILAHAVTNLILSGYVIATGKWFYW